MRWYRVVFETYPASKRVTAKLPTLNNTADYGTTAEEAVANLRVLAQGFLDVLHNRTEPIPPSDRTGPAPAPPRLRGYYELQFRRDRHPPLW